MPANSLWKSARADRAAVWGPEAADGRLWRAGAAIAGNRAMPQRRIRKWSHVAWNDSRAGSLDSTALGGVELKERPTGTTPPPSGVLINGLSPPGWGRFLDIRIWPFKVLVEGGPRDCCCTMAAGARSRTRRVFTRRC